MPKFQTRHYTDVASVLRTATKDIDAITDQGRRVAALMTVKQIEDDLSDLFAHDNPKFKPDQFAAAVHS